MQTLGRGGMGTVYLAEDPLAGRLVAVKELRAPAGLPDAEREIFVKRAMQEARSAARIQHPGVVTLYDVVPPSPGDDAMYLVMEYIDGGSFADEMRRGGPLALRRVTEVGLQLLSVLEAAHALGVVHRDIKPANILITRSGQAKLTDFGIAYMAGDTRLTGNGAVTGTMAYMAPELFESGTITPAVDIWALGATLYHAADGRNPFDRGATGPTLRAILLDPLPDPGCGTNLATACTAMLQRDPTSRATIAQVRALMTGAMPPTANAGPRPDASGTTRSPRSDDLRTQTLEVDQQGFLPRLRSTFNSR
ncbi:MAG TPA: serine/threonine-protein kinase [Trebonia sp.]|nr:serine/threonine-protein kinase [Trebonia sp.]